MERPQWKLTGKMVLAILLSAASVSCSMDAAIINNVSKKNENRKTPDFINGESVQALKGNYQVQAVFGEIAEKTQSKNGEWNVEGTFYE